MIPDAGGSGSEFSVDDVAITIVREIARKALENDYDILLAARDICDLRHRLPTMPGHTMDPIVGVAEEAADLPLGNERQHWAADALRAKDELAADYRGRVTTIMKQALLELISTLDNVGERADLS